MLYHELIKLHEKDMIIEEPEKTPTTKNAEKVSRFSESLVDEGEWKASTDYDI